MSSKQLELWNKLNENNTLKEIQQYIKNVIEIRGFADQEIEKTMLLLLEKVGELYDVLYYIICLANTYDIDLQNSIFLKEELNSKKYNRKSICDDFV